VRDAHDRVDDVQALVELLEVFGFVRARPARSSRCCRPFGAHRVRQADLDQVLAHLFAAAEGVHELLIEPGLVDLEVRVGQDAVAIEALDVVALVGAAVAEDVHVVFAHGANDGGGGDRAARAGVVLKYFLPPLDRWKAPHWIAVRPSCTMRATVDQPRSDRAVLERGTRDVSDPSRRLRQVRRVTYTFIPLGSAKPRRNGCRAHPKKRYPDECPRAEAIGKSGSWRALTIAAIVSTRRPVPVCANRASPLPRAAGPTACQDPSCLPSGAPSDGDDLSSVADGIFSPSSSHALAVLVDELDRDLDRADSPARRCGSRCRGR
jgi:hypothetical protein